MSTEIESKMMDHSLVELWGGDEYGVCLQITTITPLKVHNSIAEQLQEPGFIQVTMEEAAVLCNDLGRFVKREAQRRQALLRAQLEQLKINERTVFNEVAEIPDDLMAGPELAVLAISRFCPKIHKEQETKQAG